jgi:hypothetical protein
MRLKLESASKPPAEELEGAVTRNFVTMSKSREF